MIFDFQQKNKMRNFFFSPPVVAVVLLVALYALYSTWSIYKKLVETRQDADLVKEQVLVLEARNQKLDGYIQSLGTNAGIEKEIRNKFGVAKPGEEMAVIVETETDTAYTKTPKGSWWVRFAGFFGF